MLNDLYNFSFNYENLMLFNKLNNLIYIYIYLILFNIFSFYFIIVFYIFKHFNATSFYSLIVYDFAIISFVVVYVDFIVFSSINYVLIYFVILIDVYFSHLHIFSIYFFDLHPISFFDLHIFCFNLPFFSFTNNNHYNNFYLTMNNHIYSMINFDKM